MSDDGDFFSLDISLPDRKPILDPPVLKVYLASALTNLDEATMHEAAAGRAVICDLLRRYDYFGVRFKVYDPADVTPPGSPHSDDEVYIMDHHQTSHSDLVVFYVLAPSIGVGMEAQIAADCTLPRVVVSRRKSAVSRMFRGVFSPTIASIAYGDVAELRDELSEELMSIAKASVESAIRRREHVEGFCKNAIGCQMMCRRLELDLPLSELARLTDIRESWLQRIECDVSVAASVTLIELHRIATGLGAVASVSESGFPTIKYCDGHYSLDDIERQSLKNLIEFATQREHPTDDNRVRALWQSYRRQHAEEIVEAGPFREKQPVSVDEWIRRYNAKDGRLF